MPAVNTLGIWYPDGYPGRAFDLNEIVAVVYPEAFPDRVEVRFRASSTQPVMFDRTEFEDAYDFAQNNPLAAKLATAINYNTEGGSINFNRSTPAFNPDTLEMVAANEPRQRSFSIGSFQYTMTLIEAASTNLLLYSQDFSQAEWVASSVVFSTTGVAPDGSSTAAQISDGGGILQSAGAGALAEVYAASAYVKGTFDEVDIVVDNGTDEARATVDLSDGSISSTSGALQVDAAVETVGDGWYRVTVTGEGDFSADRRLQIIPTDTGANKRLSIWATQLEADACSSYIPTTSAPAARTRDQLINTLTTPITYGSTIFTAYVPHLWTAHPGIDYEKVFWQQVGGPGRALHYIDTTGTGVTLRRDTTTGTADGPVGNAYLEGGKAGTVAAAFLASGLEHRGYTQGAPQGTTAAAGGTFYDIDALRLGEFDGDQFNYIWVGVLGFAEALVDAEIAELHSLTEVPGAM